jgi:hypothetical protein
MRKSEAGIAKHGGVVPHTPSHDAITPSGRCIFARPFRIALALSLLRSAPRLRSTTSAEYVYTPPTCERKTAFLSHLYLETIIFPRQARDKHRENSKKGAVFRTQPTPPSKQASSTRSLMSTVLKAFFLSLCLSRVCLGEMFVLYINGSKTTLGIDPKVSVLSRAPAD